MTLICKLSIEYYDFTSSYDIDEFFIEKEASFQSDDETSFQLNLCVYYILFD